MAKTYEPIATTTLSSAASEINFTSITSTYTDLILVLQGNASTASTGVRNLFLQFNGDTASNYSVTLLYGDGSGAFSVRTSSATQMLWSDIPMANSTAIKPNVSTAHIMSYANTNVNKTVLATTAADIYVERTVGLWRSTAAITSIKVYPGASDTFASGTRASLYGIKAKSPALPLLTESTKTTSSVSAIIGNYDAGLTYTATSSAGTATVSTNTVSVTGLNPDSNVDITVTATNGANSSSSNSISITSGPVASGGTVTESGGYRYHTFTTSGTFTLNQAKDVEYLVVAGGGSGGAAQGQNTSYNAGGGGGAGGLLSTSASLAAQSYSVIVGAGGNGSNGSNSVISSSTATGGGKGGSSIGPSISAGSPGGSGGGGGNRADPGGWAAGGAGISGQGNSGARGGPGSGPPTGARYSGGGGGAGGAAPVGFESPWGTAGAGSSWNGTAYATGGSGAQAGTNGAGSNGTAGTGNGGGGAAKNPSPSPFAGGAGGSGVVIIRYAI